MEHDKFLGSHEDLKLKTNVARKGDKAPNTPEIVKREAIEKIQRQWNLPRGRKETIRAAQGYEHYKLHTIKLYRSIIHITI